MAENLNVAHQEEKIIANDKVIQYFRDLGWPDELISKYGRVPVKMGTAVKFADLVLLFIDSHQHTHPYLVIEVKRNIEENFDDILTQVDSYAKLLDTQIFVITDGETYRPFQRFPWGDHIELKDIPIPEKEHISVKEDTFIETPFDMLKLLDIPRERLRIIYEKLECKIDSFLSLITQGKYFRGKEKYSLRKDILSHYLAIKQIKNVFLQDEIGPDQIRNLFDENNKSIMDDRVANRKLLLSEITEHFPRVTEFLNFIKNLDENRQDEIDQLFNGKLHLPGTGVFIVSQFLAGAHPINYTIIEDRMVRNMKELGLIDAKVHSRNVDGYLYINDICKRLKKEVFSEKINQFKDQLDFKIDEDFDLIFIHDFFWEYEGFYKYDTTKLAEITGEELAEEELETSDHLNRLNILQQNGV
ncbi:MAG TPA: type I restriction enzyme HsdR N-terminal domain-containing protein [Candidatus Lokiarchaeia archaeon]|nr:type I restriction enzyme HsdR N-terminal domain-containing protein [Candidatus Lokiarchaeia archaeon]